MITSVFLDEELEKLAKKTKDKGEKHTMRWAAQCIRSDRRAHDEALKGPPVMLTWGSGENAVDVKFARRHRRTGVAARHQPLLGSTSFGGSWRRGSQSAHGQSCGACVTELCNNCGGLKRQGKPCRKCGTITAVP